MSLHPMDPVDAAWYHMDGPANRAIVTSLLLARHGLDFARVRRALFERVASLDRFRQRVVETGLPLPTPHWQDCDDFDIDRHVVHVALPAPAEGEPQLHHLLDELASTPLDESLPLWQAHVIDRGRAGSATVLRYHHCIGDGAAMMAVAQRLFDTSARPRRKADGHEALAFAPEAGAGWLRPAFELVEAASRAAWSAWHLSSEALMHPQQVAQGAATVMKGAGMLVGELLKSPDTATVLKGEFALPKRVAWSAPVPVSDLKAVAAPLNAKVNDVLVAAVGGALRSYLAGRGLPVDHMVVRAMVPVNLRPPQRCGQLGNEFGLVILDLPVAERGALKRLATAKARMDQLKQSPEPVAMKLLMDVFGRTPKLVQGVAQGLFGSKASLVLTNVAGPRQQLFLAGSPVDRMLFWVPHPGEDLGVGLSLMSYCGQATLGVQADARLVPDPQAITQAFEHECRSMIEHLHAAEERANAMHKAGKARREPAS